MSKLILIGGGGHCKSVLDAALRSGRFNEIVITDPVITAGSTILGCKVVGTDDMLPVMLREGFTQAFVTVGSIQSYAVRKKLVQLAEQIGLTFPVIADPSAVISKFANIGQGTFIGKNAVVNSGTIVGQHCIVNTGAILEHDCRIGNFCHVSVGSILCGGVTLGNGVFVGAGSTVIQMVNIASDAMIGAHSTILTDVGEKMKLNGIVKLMVEKSKRGGTT